MLDGTYDLLCMPLYGDTGQDRTLLDQCAALKAEGEKRYAALLSRVKSFDRSVDFKALRHASVHDADYGPYGGDTEREKTMLAALRDKEYEKALEYALSLLDENYMDIDAHSVCQIAYGEMKQLERSEYHGFVVDGLIESLLASGDGKTPETAYVAISIKEEYVALDVLGLQVQEQSLMGAAGHEYDLFKVRNPATGEVSALYFNVDRPRRWLHHLLLKTLKQPQASFGRVYE